MPTASAVKKMKHWVDIFEPALDYDFLPSMRAIGGAIIYNKSYFVSGRTRKDRPHLIFQYTLQGEAEMALGQKKFRCPEGTGFLCYSHDPELTYYYPEECNEELHTVYFCLYGAEAIGRELIQKYGHESVFILSSPIHGKNIISLT